jgi:hypothetical protein
MSPACWFVAATLTVAPASISTVHEVLITIPGARPLT